MYTFGNLSLDLMAIVGVDLGRDRSGFGFQEESFTAEETVEIFRDPESRAGELLLAPKDWCSFLECWKSWRDQSKEWVSKVGRQCAEEDKVVVAGARMEIV